MELMESSFDLTEPLVLNFKKELLDDAYPLSTDAVYQTKNKAGLVLKSLL
jgi:hypothetical protein